MTKNICKIDEFDESIFFKAICGCSDDEHNQTLILENDEYCVNLSIHTQLYSKHYLSKWQLIWKVLTNGYISLDTEFIFEDAESIKSYIAALQNGLEKLRK
jgi:hypothetical protein